MQSIEVGSSRELIPLLLIRKNADDNGWFNSRVELARQIELIQRKNPELMEKITGKAAPYGFDPERPIPISEDLFGDLLELRRSGLVDDEELPFSERKLSTYHRFRLTPEGVKVTDKMLSDLIMRRAIRERIVLKAIRNASVPRKDHRNRFETIPTLIERSLLLPP